MIHPTYPPELRYPTYNLTDMTKRHSLCLCLSSQLPGSNVPTSIDLFIYLFGYLFIYLFDPTVKKVLFPKKVFLPVVGAKKVLYHSPQLIN